MYPVWIVKIEAIVKPKFPTYKIRFVRKASPTIRKPMDIICIIVFHFDKLVTSRLLLECKKKSLSPDTITSL
mgnify:CR=1